MHDTDYTIELFVFPDGTRVEMIVFDSAARAREAGLRHPSQSPGSVPAAQASAGRAAAPNRAAPPPCRVPPQQEEDRDAHHCPVCRSPLVYPVDWDRSGPASWTMILRCPECETRREVTLGRASVEELNRELYQGAQAIAREADLLTRRNFEDEVERMVAALERDLILPMDF